MASLCFFAYKALYANVFIEFRKRLMHFQCLLFYEKKIKNSLEINECFERLCIFICEKKIEVNKNFDARIGRMIKNGMR